MCRYSLIVLCCLVSGYYTVDAQSLSETSTTELPIIINEEEINRTSDGYCTFHVTKRKVVVVPVQYSDIETFYTRCRGYYFRKCLNERQVVKTRMENQVQQYNETVEKCCDGYAQSPDKNRCLAICEHNCIYGDCTAPNECSCYIGYEKETNKTNVCAPKCVGCTYGSCISPNVCFCNQGYNWDMDALECVPVCDGNCHNGKCIAPNQCQCHEGFVHHPLHSVCVPNCNGGCVKGQCIAPNKCECDLGYKFINGSQSVCEPICEMSCKNAKCINPNTCECHHGYTVLDDDKPHECHCGMYCAEIDGMCHCLDDDHRVNGDMIRNNYTAICTENSCENGVCLTPYDCDCYDGFEKDENLICTAVNETCIDDPANCNAGDSKTCNCINGICSLSNQCHCVNGFKMSEDLDNVCEPHCTKECVHGFCINPDECECDIGYRLGYNETELHICHPICDPEAEDNNGCTNGTCIAPDTCHCFEGFMLSNQMNFTCIPDPFYAERQTSQTTWVMSTLVLVMILAALVAAVYYFNKHRLQNYSTPRLDDEANQPITGYVSEEL